MLSVDIYGISHRLEGVEAKSERDGYIPKVVFGGMGNSEECFEIFHKESEIFEGEQNP